MYGDGLEDLKDCFTFGGRIGGGGSRGGGRTTSHSSRGSYYGGHHPHSSAGNGAGYYRDDGICDDCTCIEGVGEGCSKKRFGVIIIFIWLFILTIVMIVIGSNVAYTSNHALSSRLDDHYMEQNTRMNKHNKLLGDLNRVHSKTVDRVDGVSGAVKQLKGDVNLLEGNMRGHIQNRLTNVRSVLIQALDKAGKSLQQIKTDVQKGMV